MFRERYPLQPKWTTLRSSLLRSLYERVDSLITALPLGYVSYIRTWQPIQIKVQVQLKKRRTFQKLHTYKGMQSLSITAQSALSPRSLSSGDTTQLVGFTDYQVWTLSHGGSVRVSISQVYHFTVVHDWFITKNVCYF